MAASPVTTVVSIVTWRAGKLTVQCLEALALEASALPGVHVLVVDNDSGDGTAEVVEAAIRANGWSAWATLLRSPVNGGFAAGNNFALRHALPLYPDYKYFLLLNPDTAIRAGAIRTLMDFMAASPHVGIAGGQCEDPDGTPQTCAFRFPSMLTEFGDQLRLGAFDRLIRKRLVRIDTQYQSIEVGWVSGAVMMIRRQVFESIGMMDESYFLYFEETDFSLRALRAGWPTWHVPAARAVHHVGQLTGVRFGAERPNRLPGYWFASRRRYYVVNHGLVRAIAVDLAVLAGQALWQLRRLLERKPAVDPPCWVGDLLRLGVLRQGRRGVAPRRTS
ncbi:MAG: glycosyltransferase family 2 protein [Steroidobacteraceae bacterium]